MVDAYSKVNLSDDRMYLPSKRRSRYRRGHQRGGLPGVAGGVAAAAFHGLIRLALVIWGCIRRCARHAARRISHCSEDSFIDISENGNAPAATSEKAKNTHATALTTPAELTDGSANPARFAIIPASADANEFAII